MNLDPVEFSTFVSPCNSSKVSKCGKLGHLKSVFLSSRNCVYGIMKGIPEHESCILGHANLLQFN